MLLSGTGQNVVGLGIAALAMFIVQILISRTLGPRAFGLVTVATQGAFVLSFLTRGGMDMAVLRDVANSAIAVAHKRAIVGRASLIALAISAGCAILVAVAAPTLARLTGFGDAGTFRAAAIGLPFLALSSVTLAATRGLKIMRYTLYVFWAGQNVVWIILTVVLWRFETSATMAVLAYSLSWVWAAIAAQWFWHRETHDWPKESPPDGDLQRVARYAAPRAPAALFAQLLFWTDLFIVTRFVTSEAVGVYGAALRAGQIAMLFLTSVNLMFAPFVADLYARGERAELDRLYKLLTRWILAATLPVFVVAAIAPGEVMTIFGGSFEGGMAALLILLVGQLVNVATGSSGFILIMVGRTGWDFVIYAGSIVLNVALAFVLCPRFGIEGAALANAVTLTLSNLARLAAVRHFVKIHPYDRRYASLMGPALVAIGSAWVAHAAMDAGYILDLSVTAVVAGLAYAAGYWLLALTPSEKVKVKSLLGRMAAR